VFHDKTIISSFIELNGGKVNSTNYSLGMGVSNSVDIQFKNKWYPTYSKTVVHNTPLRTWVENYYTTDAVTKNSPSLVKVAKQFKKGIFGSKK
jgi:hypothetical protein